MTKTLEEIKELVGELSSAEKLRLLAFISNQLVETSIAFRQPPIEGGEEKLVISEIPLLSYPENETDEERHRRIEAFLQELDETAIDIASDSVEDIRQMRKERDEHILKVAGI